MAADDALPLYEPAELGLDLDGIETLGHAVVLAAGRSRRYGRSNKLLVPIDGEAMVRHAVRTAVDSAATGVTVVVGFEADQVRSALEGFDVEVRENEAFDEGQSASVALGVAAALEREADAVVVLLGDMPFVTADTVDLLLAAHGTGRWDAIAAAYRGRRGNPVLFDRDRFDDLAAVDGDMGGRDLLLGSASAILLETGDPGVVRDIDRPTDR